MEAMNETKRIEMTIMPDGTEAEAAACVRRVNQQEARLEKAGGDRNWERGSLRMIPRPGGVGHGLGSSIRRRYRVVGIRLNPWWID